MGSEKPYRRKQYLVDRGYQLRFVTRVFAVVLIVAVVSSMISTGLLWMNMYRPDLEQSTTLIAALIAVATTLLVELLISIPLVYFLGIRQSHRVVGPINRMKRVLEAIGAGDFSQRIIVRRGDALEDVAKTINEMAERLGQRSSRTPGSS
jgi:methyl-accepting chemotaxis protein